MNTKAIERIKGYCCEVKQKQWEELVKVADKVGCPVESDSRKKGTEEGTWIHAMECEGEIIICVNNVGDQLIPFHDFLAKLRGDEEWEPKAGEMVEVEVGNTNTTWVKAEMVCVHKGYYICNEVNNWQYLPFKLNQIRPLLPTITRAEAESKLNARIID